MLIVISTVFGKQISNILTQGVAEKAAPILFLYVEIVIIQWYTKEKPKETGGKRMGFFDLFKHTDINQGVAQFQQASNAVLVDVRTPEEYREGHIPGSINVPLQQIEDIDLEVSDMSTPLFVYCRSGARSRQATAMLQEMGYEEVHNIGGILDYKGKVEL